MPRHMTFYMINWGLILMLAAGLCFGVSASPASASSTKDPEFENANLQIDADPTTDSGWNSDGSIFAISRAYSGLYLYDQNMQQVGFIPIVAAGGIGDIEWNPVDPQLIAVIAESRPTTNMEVWNVLSVTQVFSTDLALSGRPKMSWNSTGSQLAIVGGSIGEVWDISTGNQAFELNRTGDLATDRLFDVKWNTVQNLIATDGIGDEIILWDGTNGQQTDSIPQVGFMAWSPDGSQLALLNETLDIYDLGLEQVVQSLPTVGSPLSTLWQGDVLVTISIVVDGNSFVQLVDTTTFQVIETIELSDTPQVALTSDGVLLTLVDISGNIDLRSTQPTNSSPPIPPKRRSPRQQ